MMNNTISDCGNEKIGKDKETMIDILYKKCCENCPHLSVDYEDWDTLAEKRTVIGCAHMTVCKDYLQGKEAGAPEMKENKESEEPGKSRKQLESGNPVKGCGSCVYWRKQICENKNSDFRFDFTSWDFCCKHYVPEGLAKPEQKARREAMEIQKMLARI
jgi:hypothetical protein